MPGAGAAAPAKPELHTLPSGIMPSKNRDTYHRMKTLAPCFVFSSTHP